MSVYCSLTRSVRRDVVWTHSLALNATANRDFTMTAIYWNVSVKSHTNTHICDLCWQNESECARTNLLLYRQKNKKWKMSVLVEFEVFTKISSLSPLLAIPMLQIVIKHLKWSLFVCFLRGVPFLCSLLDDCCFSPHVVGLLSQRAAFQLCEYSYRILDYMSPNQWNMIFKPMLMKTIRSRWLTFAKRVHKTRLSSNAQSLL